MSLPNVPPYQPLFNYPNNKLYQYEAYPILLSCNFVVDSQNGNGLGIRSLKGSGIANIFMNSDAAPLLSPNLGLARTYAMFGGSALTNTGSSVLTGNIGIFPGTSVTGFPPGTFSGQEHVADSAASAAKAQAQAAYTEMAARSATPISSTLDGQTLVPGVYSESSGTFNLAQSGNGTLILNGNGVYIFKAASTLVTGAGGIPTITLSGGAKASNVYWIVGSSATINSGSAGVFQGNVIAVASITDTLGGTVNGSLIALNGAVTLSAASIINVQPLAGTPGIGNYGMVNPNPAPGYILVQFSNQFSRYLSGFSGFVSPLSGSTLTSVVAGQAYVIVSLGTASLVQWQAKGFPMGMVPALGAAFIASASGSIGGSGAVQAPSASGISSIEVVGDPNQTLQNSNLYLNGGAQMVLQCLANALPLAPLDGSVIGLNFYLSNSSVAVNGQ